MKADREAFMEQARLLGRLALLELAVSLYDELEDVRMKQLENDRIRTEAHIQYSELSEKYSAVLVENADLKVLLKKEIEKNSLKTKSTFGRKTEGFLSIVDAVDNPEEEPVDESETEDEGTAEERKVRVIDFARHKEKKAEGKKASTSKQDRRPVRLPGQTASAAHV